MNAPRPMRHQHGLSLVELMVALTISLVLLSGVVQVFTTSKATYRSQDNLSRVQETGRFALEFIAKDLRMAGFTGCFRNVLKNENVKNTLNGPIPATFDIETPIEGENNTNLNGSDEITVRGFSDQGLALTTSMPDTSAVLKVTSGLSPPPLADNDIVLVTDCSAAAIFQITNFSNSSGTVVHNTGVGTPGNATKNLGKSFDNTATIYRNTSYRYFIAEGASGSPSLFRVDGTAAAQELVEGIENLQLRYGEDSDGDNAADRYLDADDAALDMDRVVSVRVSILVQSPELVNPQVDSSKYDMLGTPGDATDDISPVAADRKIRRLFSTVVQLRNKGLI